MARSTPTGHVAAAWMTCASESGRASSRPNRVGTTCVLVPATPRPEHRQSLAAPLKALGHRGLLTMGLTALLYNWGFFTMLGYVPFPMALSIYQLGSVFFGWGVLVAVFSVFVAPRLQRRFGTAPTLYVNLFLFAAVLAVIVAGAMIGVNNTLTNQAVMLVSPVERPVASAAYGFIRFIGAGIAPFVAGILFERLNVHVPFWIASGALLLAIGVLATGHKLLAAADVKLAEGETAHAGEADLDADEIEETFEDGTGEAGVRERAEYDPAR